MKHKIIYILFLAYICGCGFKQDIERQPVIATISRISCSCYEDTLLDRNSMDDIRQIFFCIDVVNPNDMDMYIPVRSGFDKKFQSEIGIFMDTIRLYRYVVTKDMNFMILKAHERTSMRIRLFDNLNKNSFGATHDIKKLLEKLRFEYLKCDADTQYYKKEIADMKFVVSDSLKIEYKKIDDEE